MTSAIERLRAVSNLVGDRLRAGVDPAAVVAELIRDCGATAPYRCGAYTLRCAGVTASCTWSADRGLLDHWTRNAALRLMGIANA